MFPTILGVSKAADALCLGAQAGGAVTMRACSPSPTDEGDHAEDVPGTEGDRTGLHGRGRGNRASTSQGVSSSDSDEA